MSYKRVFLIFLLIFGICCTTALGSSISSYIQTNMTNQNPNPAHPGEPIELTFVVQNLGSNNVKDVVVTVKPHTGSSFYPFSQLDNQPLSQSISYLNAMQNGNDATTVKIQLSIDQGAAADTYYIDVTTTYKEDTDASTVSSTTTTVPITLKGKEYAQVVTINTANIDIGKVEPLQFKITNTGNSPLQNMVVSWTDPKNVIFPVYSDNTKYIKYLDAGSAVNVDYNVMADVNANPGLYNINVDLSFQNYNSQPSDVKTTAGLFVGGPTDFDVSYSESAQGQVAIAVANVGNTMANAVKVSIPKQQGYIIGGSPSIIIGNLQKGDYTIASFNVSSTNVNESVPLKVEIAYTDPQGNRITEDKVITIPVGSANVSTFAGRSRNTTTDNNNFLYVSIVIIIIVIAVIFYRRRKQKSDKIDLSVPTVVKEETKKE